MVDLLRVVAAHIEVVRCAKTFLETEKVVNARLVNARLSTARDALVAALKQLEPVPVPSSGFIGPLQDPMRPFGTADKR
jgi:hypothetical protein